MKYIFWMYTLLSITAAYTCAKYHYSDAFYKYMKWVWIVIAMATFTVPFWIDKI